MRKTGAFLVGSQARSRAWRGPLLLTVCLAAACGAALSGCKSHASPGTVQTTTAFVSEDIGCPLASPMLVTSQGQQVILVPSSDGGVYGFDPQNGDTLFRVAMPEVDGQVADITAPPALVRDRYVVVAFQHVVPANFTRVDHQVAVIDLETRALDPAFPTVTLAGGAPDYTGNVTVPFLPGNAFSRSALAHGVPAGSTWGRVYVSFGNIQDIQPWHGWVFELDLDAWEAGGEAIANLLITTPESDCGPAGASGAREMLCGGGIWSPAGPQLHPTGDSYELYVPTGNGLVDINTQQYANSLLRVPPGLDFDPGCDPVACADFDSVDPAEACLASCQNLFVPRLLPGQELVVESGVCDGLTFFECYATLDWDLGANSPTRVTLPSGLDVMLLSAKDGAVYLFDADHFGTLYDREVVVAACGTAAEYCTADWAGMLVTKPVVTTVDGEAVVIVPAFMFDRTHPAGLVALRIVEGTEGPRLEPFWTAPDFTTAEAVNHFRRHTGRATLIDIDGEEHVIVVDVGAAGTRGTLYGVRVRDGFIAFRHDLPNPGVRYVLPLTVGNRVYVHSCSPGSPPMGQLDAIDLEVVRE